MKKGLISGLAVLLISAGADLTGVGKSYADEPIKSKSIERRIAEYKISQSGVELIKKFEGYSAKRYADVAGKSTIGYGHLIREGENYTEITKDDAEALLRMDINYAERAVQRNVSVPLTQGQYDALVSFTYNLGEGNLRSSTLLKKLNAGDYDSAASEFLRWVYAGGKKIKGLENRRKKEAELFRGLKFDK